MNKPNKHRAALEAMIATLRAVVPSFGGGLEVDEDAGVIRNAAVMTIGEASGHGFDIDATTLEQVAGLINAAGSDGVKVRFKHPQDNLGNPTDDTGTLIGRLRNARVVGDSVRGDLHLGRFAKTLPGYGDVWSYVLAVAKDDPAGSGLSAVIEYDPEPVIVDGSVQRLVARVSAVEAVDFVGRPAANPHGLLAAKKPTPKGATLMEYDDKLIPHLKAKFGMGDDEDGKEFFSKLSDEQKSELSALAEGDDPAEEEPKQAAANSAKPAAKGTALAAKPGVDVVALEAKRVSGIKALAKLYDLDDSFVRLQVASEASVEDARKAALAEIAKAAKPGNVTVGADRNVASLADGIRDGILQRAGQRVEKPHERARQFAGLSLVETARVYLNAIGIDTTYMGRVEVAKLVFDRGRLASLGKASLAFTTSDFSNILQDTIGKTLRTAYDEQPSTWAMWARRATAPDFKTISRTQLSEAPDLDLVKEHGEYTNGKMSDTKETYALEKFGKIISISWESMINDDLDAFSRIPTAMGQAAKRKEDDVAYYVLLKNAAMADGVALFHSTHGNLAAGTGKVGAPSVALLNNAVSAMMVQRGLEGKAYLNLRPQFILVPPALSGTTWEVLNSTSNPASNNANVKNRFGPGGQVPLTIVDEARLQLGVTLKGDTAPGSSTGWYLAASTSAVDTVEVSFLAEEPAPVTEEEDGFRVDGRQYKIRHTVAAKAIDHRGLYKNPGA